MSKSERVDVVQRRYAAVADRDVPFLDYDIEIRRVICSTDEIVNPIRWLSGDALDPCSSAVAGAA